ncbi:MAG: sugar ABC transporter ATP-binding protein [Desulfitobacteriaceae bacterium]
MQIPKPESQSDENRSGTIPKFALQLKRVSKRYPGTLAVDNIDFEVLPGEVHALIGENGAGKSSLMKIIAGSFHDYTGQILVNGKEVALHSPSMAKANGIEMIYQELSMALPLSIAENVLVGRLPKKYRFFLDKKAMIRETKVCLEQVRLGHLDVNVAIEKISPSEAQLVEIAKALGNNPSILVMDEPTSSLSREEVERLFDIITKMKQQGLAIIYISHHLPEIFKIADRVTVMRDGKKVATKNIAEVTTEEMIEMMIGRAVSDLFMERSAPKEKIMLQANGLSRYGFFHDVSFHAKAGEIVGIAGLSGSGRTELAKSIVGADPLDEGEIAVNGTKITINNIGEALNSGIAYLTEDRKTLGLALKLSVEENILSAMIPKHTKRFVYSKKEGLLQQKRLISELNIYPPDPTRIVGNLSGGNQQKALLAKWLATDPQVLILDEPTRGVDIGAKIVIHREIAKLTDMGKAVILISSDLPELVGLSDRIMIMRKGHFIGEMKREQCNEELVLLAMNGEGRMIHAG